MFSLSCWMICRDQWPCLLLACRNPSVVFGLENDFCLIGGEGTVFSVGSLCETPWIKDLILLLRIFKQLITGGETNWERDQISRCQRSTFLLVSHVSFVPFSKKDYNGQIFKKKIL